MYSFIYVLPTFTDIWLSSDVGVIALLPRQLRLLFSSFALRFSLLYIYKCKTVTSIQCIRSGKKSFATFWQTRTDLTALDGEKTTLDSF